MKKKYTLYLDCDGVLVDSIRVSYKEIEELGIKDNEEAIIKYYKEIDWNDLIARSGLIDNSIEKIKELKKTNIFKDIIILTKVVTEREGLIKTDYFNELIPDIKVVYLLSHLDKHNVVDPINSILVDDHKKNIHKWIAAGGIGYQFKKDKTDLNNNIIGDLIELKDLYKEKTVKN